MTDTNERALPDVPPIPVQTARSIAHETRPMSSTALVEQAKGALVFRYGTDADTALAVLELWADQRETELTRVAYVLIHDICRGVDAPTDRELARWLEEQLRKECPEIHLEVTPGAPVTAFVDHSLSSLDTVLDAARRAARLGVPLELRFAEEVAGPARAHLYQRLDLAVELARAVEPGVPVQLPTVGAPD
ncbi:ANTAR domain-containing protein [Nocardioides caldifontis]|uniref:ANTAR domain-containing protein n=1 Tax=Nocardioides caldifontis TaxID=2588938 RepID=UPI0011DF8A9D|nr:ANTAR domain-containing protein [Nocardioides caldifontis]